MKSPCPECALGADPSCELCGGLGWLGMNKAYSVWSDTWTLTDEQKTTARLVVDVLGTRDVTDFAMSEAPDLWRTWTNGTCDDYRMCDLVTTKTSQEIVLALFRYRPDRIMELIRDDVAVAKLLLDAVGLSDRMIDLLYAAKQKVAR